MEKSPTKNMSCGTKISDFLVSKMEAIFYRHGKFVASHPFAVIFVSALVCLVASLGCFMFRIESKPEKLWIPKDSGQAKTLEWQKENYPDNIRTEMVIFEAENVLKPKYIKEMFSLKEKIQSLFVFDRDGKNRTYGDMCFRVPSLGDDVKRKLDILRKHLFKIIKTREDSFDWTQVLPRHVYCEFFGLMQTSCLYLGILDMWPSNTSIIENLTEEDVLWSVNHVAESATYAYPMNFTSFLGGVSRNETGHVTGAKSVIHFWNMQVNRDEIFSENRISAGLTFDVDKALFDWEDKFIDTVLMWKKSLPEGLDSWPQAIRSFMDVSEGAIFGDVKYIICGTVLLSTYVFLVLGKFNMVETRPVLCVLGIMSIYLSTGFAYGVCGALGIIYGPVHSILPLLLIGLGVDDMFVIVQSLEVLQKAKPKTSIINFEEKMGTVLSNSGVAITVTSLTDFLAFFIGSTTRMPALQSFCVYAAVAILSLYLMQITFFFAVLSLDQTRLEANRNGFLWCVKHRNWTPDSCSQVIYSQLLLEKIYAPKLLKPASKVLVLLATAVLTSFSIWGLVNLRVEFKVIRFIPSTTYTANFMLKLEEYFPDAGGTGTVYVDEIDLPRELPKLQWLTSKIKENKWIVSVDSWYEPLVNYALSSSGVNLEQEDVSSDFFSRIMVKFLFSPTGMKYQPDFYFEESPRCNDNATHILAFKFHFRHRRIHDAYEQLEAMTEMKQLVKSANFSGFSACTAYLYNEWESNKTLVKDLAQNLGLALAAVFVMTSILIANLRSSLLVMLCVALTMADVMALMNWWDLTVDILTCIHLVLCVGLSVDYSAHVALHFMKVQGTRDERAFKTLSEIGVPVFNGAFSTFLSFVLLSNSSSYVFKSFFKIFFGVFVFGVFHGLVFLPVVLSLVGPASYKDQFDHPTTGQVANAKEELHSLEHIHSDSDSH